MGKARQDVDMKGKQRLRVAQPARLCARAGRRPAPLRNRALSGQVLPIHNPDLGVLLIWLTFYALRLAIVHLSRESTPFFRG